MQLYHGLIHVSLPWSPETAIAHTKLSQCGSTLLIRAKPLPGMVSIAHAVVTAMAVSSGLAIADMGTTILPVATSTRAILVMAVV